MGTARSDATIRMHAPVVRDDGVADRVAVEEPLEIRVRGRALAVTMRTPGHDEELAAGFLHGEGLLAGPIASVGPTADLAANTVDVDAPLRPEARERRFYTTSSCGVCGKGALEEVAVHAERLGPGPAIDRALLAALPDRLRQPGFDVTGGLHATGLFDPAGTLLCVREDVGRHNAMDKVIGRALLDGDLPLDRAGSSASRAGSRSSSCRRRRSPAARSSSASARPPRWPSSWPPTAR